jgi:uncharacterized membrane protein
MIDLILTIIPGEWLAGLLALLAAFFGVWITGRRSGAVRAEKRGLEDYKATRKAIDDVEDVGDDPATLRDWLRERGEPKRPL